MKESPNKQLMVLINAGLTIEMAAQSLGLSTDAAMIALASENGRLVNPELFNPERKRKMEHILEHIAANGENESARVKAAIYLCENSGKLPPVSANKVDEVLNKMKAIKDSLRTSGTLIDVSTCS